VGSEGEGARASLGSKALCPSAQPDMEESQVLGVVGGSVAAPKVAYLSDTLPVTPDVLRLAEPVDPTEVFRFAARCAETACQHYAEGRCQLAQRIVQLVPSTLADLPPCRIRPRCRWWQEQGAEACLRCPFVVTLDYRAGEVLQEAAGPARSGAAADR
jgi:hypothetical protein